MESDSKPSEAQLLHDFVCFKVFADGHSSDTESSRDDEGEDIVFTAPSYFQIRKDGRVERFRGNETIPPGTDDRTGVRSKDVVISPDNKVGARLYIPKEADFGEKLPLLVHFHGGGFCLFSAWHPWYYLYLSRLASQAKVVIVSVDYRLVPEHPLPAAYDDCWAAIKWAAAHSTGDGPEPWLNEFADYGNVFFAGESAGGNIAHQMALRAGTNPLPGIKLKGVIIDVPFFFGAESIGKESGLPETEREKGEKIWLKAIPDLKTLDHPWINPLADLEKMSKMGCKRVLVHVAEVDSLRDRGVAYYEALRGCGWSGRAELFESRGVGHAFQLFNPKCQQVEELLKKYVEFINEGVRDA
uniref:Alpha/beta hydrolase fold-3 domain-containing protein n=1 Tax=Kalanchoe fedtschenkoi TaxID=63787 RepID=A0A7N0TPQ7_KALFE